MGKFTRDITSAPQEEVKQRFVKGTPDKLTKAHRWSGWISEAIFYPQTKRQNATGRMGYIVIKFRPYMQTNGILSTYSPSIMINKTEEFFWNMMNGTNTGGSVGKAYLLEKADRDYAINKKLGIVTHAPLNSQRGKAILEYNKKEDKYHVLQNNSVKFLNKKARQPLRTKRIKSNLKKR